MRWPAYLNAQIDAGAQAVMMFDSWGGVLADGAFQDFSLAYTARVLAQLQREGADGQPVPRIVFTKGGGLWLEDMRALDCEVLGLDWTVNLGRARALVGEGGRAPRRCRATSIPTCCSRRPAQIEAEVAKVLQSFGRAACRRRAAGPTHIFNLGHGISQFTPPEHVAALVDAVHAQSRALRRAE